jgi:cytidylate kinase
MDPLETFTSKFEAAVQRVLGGDALRELRSSFSDVPVILLAGDQLTGKSTAARGLAQRHSSRAGSTGSLVRAMAAEAEVSVEEMSLGLQDDPWSDVRLDFGAAWSIAAGEVRVFEARLAGFLGAWLRSLGRQNLFSAYLFCPPREQALRYVFREVSQQARAKVEQLLELPPEVDLATSLRIISRSALSEVQGIDQLVEKIAKRDELSSERLRKLYGIDHRDTSVFDAIIDTSCGTPRETVLAIERSAGWSL